MDDTTKRQRASHSCRQGASKASGQRVVPKASRVVRRLKVLYIFIKFEPECTQLGAIPSRSVEACITKREICSGIRDDVRQKASYGRRVDGRGSG
jgi:hypothetical protein